MAPSAMQASSPVQLPGKLGISPFIMLFWIMLNLHLRMKEVKTTQLLWYHVPMQAASDDGKAMVAMAICNDDGDNSAAMTTTVQCSVVKVMMMTIITTTVQRGNSDDDKGLVL
ncbi:hypothetical protein EDB86DRAFT_2841096 [Lactarius hatsudake]|nr:hypothetical protein EDB86DRAFT_2841096 [Lactarius hatsudake]